MLESSIYTLLSTDYTLTALLGTYQSNPSILLVDPAPAGVKLPMILTAGEIVQVPFDTKTTLGRTVYRDIRCYAIAGGDPSFVEAIAERVREDLHRVPLTITGFNNFIIECTGPIKADADGVYGRIVTVKAVIEET